jgi:ubiquinone/menaquinone biosynthesis C-methylase UbiE
VLEIGAGTGELTELVARHVGPTGSVVALDPSASMIDVLEQRMRRAGLDNVSTIVTTIEAADLPASAFDAVLGRYVLMLIADPVSAMTKIRLSLRDAARAAMAVFSTPAQNPLISLPPEILRRHAGLDASVGLPVNLFRLGEASKLKAVFIASGYEQVTVEPITSTHRLPSVDEACRMLRGFPLIHQLESALELQAKAAAWHEIEAWLTSMIENDVVVISAESLVAAGGA